MKKRWTAVLLALALVTALLPVPAQAASADSSAGARLTGVNRVVYDYLKTEIGKVSHGRRNNTEFRVPNQSSLSWTLQELNAAGDSWDGIRAKAKAKLQDTLDMQLVYGCLMVDCPYELFWSKNNYGVSYTCSQRGNRVSIESLVVTIDVAKDYQGDKATTLNMYEMGRAGWALDNAQDIVKKHENKSDYDKLAAYRDEICQLVSYNQQAAQSSSYGNPWQMVYVFDLDPDTNVVCEGYAKAFKYLCDLSRFDGDVTCRIVFGDMGGGRHMWNVVQMGDGRNYLVDVTNSEPGTIGERGELFLAGAAASAEGDRYSFAIGRWEAVYTYDPVTEGMFTDGYLPLSETSYVDTGTVTPPSQSQAPSQPQTPPQSQAPAVTAFQDVPAGEYYAEPVAWAVEHEITKGTSNTTFSPNEPCTHAQIITFLWRAMGEPAGEGTAPAGVDPGEYCYEAVRWASGLGMLWNDFDPNEGCGRADAVWYMWNASLRPEASTVSPFRDVPAASVYADAVNWAVSRQVTNGTSETTFEPWTICTRGQIVTFLYRGI